MKEEEEVDEVLDALVDHYKTGGFYLRGQINALEWILDKDDTSLDVETYDPDEVARSDDGYPVITDIDDRNG